MAESDVGARFSMTRSKARGGGGIGSFLLFPQGSVGPSNRVLLCIVHQRTARKLVVSIDSQKVVLKASQIARDTKSRLLEHEAELSAKLA